MKKISWRGLTKWFVRPPETDAVETTPVPATPPKVHDYRINKWSTTLGPVAMIDGSETPQGWRPCLDNHGRQTMTLPIAPSELTNGEISVGDHLLLGYDDTPGRTWVVTGVFGNRYALAELAP